MSWKQTLKSNIRSLELNKRQRYINIACHNKNAANVVEQTIAQNSKELCGGYTHEIKKAAGKEFRVVLPIRAAAQYFYDKLNGILNDKTVTVVEAEKSGWQKVTEKTNNVIGKVVNKVLGDEEPQQNVTVVKPSNTPVIEKTTSATAAPSGITTPPTTAAPQAVATPSAAATPQAAAQEPAKGGKKKAIIIGAAAAVVVVLIVVFVLLWKRR